MTEQTLEEQARDVYGEWLRNWNKEQRGAHQLIADFARAHAEREVEKERRLFFKALAERPVAPHPIDQLKNLQRAMTTDVEIEKLETELAALRARLDMIEKAAKPIVQYIEYVDDPKTTLEAAQRAWSPYWREFRALRDAIAAEPATDKQSLTQDQINFLTGIVR